MLGRLDASATNTTCQSLKTLVAIAAITVGSSTSANAGVVFGDVTAGLFAPVLQFTALVDVDDSDDPPSQTHLESEDGPNATTPVVEEPLVLSLRPSFFQPEPVAMSAQPQTDVSPGLADARNPALKRPATMVPLYVTFAALQLLDAHSTNRALRNGAVEGNPLMAGIASHTGALYATKIATAAATVWIGEQLWRKNRLAAIVTMLAINSAYAMVVHHNYGVVSSY